MEEKHSDTTYLYPTESDINSCFHHHSKKQTTADAIGEIVSGYDRLILTAGVSSLIDYIEEISRQLAPVSISTITWTLEDKTWWRLKKLIDSDMCENFRICIESGYANRKPGLITDMVRHLGSEKIRSTYSHAKLTTLIGPRFKALMSTSMNLNKNIRMEHLHILESGARVKFVEKWFDNIFENHEDGASLLQRIDMTEHAKSNMSAGERGVMRRSATSDIPVVDYSPVLQSYEATLK